MRRFVALFGVICIFFSFFLTLNIIAPAEALKVENKTMIEPLKSDKETTLFEINEMKLTTTNINIKITLNQEPQQPLFVKLINNGEVISSKTLIKGKNETTFNFSTSEAHELIVEDNKIHYQKILEPYLVLRFTGDVNLSSRFESVTNEKGADYLWRQINPLLKTADISFLNLETSVSDRGRKVKERLFFRTSPQNMMGLVNSGVDLVSVANNHTYDYGPIAFEDTLNFLTDNKILYAGGGRDLNAALEPKYINKKGMKIGFIAFNQIFNNTWGAADNKSGQLGYDDYTRNAIFKAIREAAAECDQLIVMAHWGVERANLPKEETKLLARALIDAGADLIVGSHPHVLQGVEVYKNKPIYYSVGNSIFTNKDEHTSGGAIFELKLNQEGIISAKFYPTYIEKKDFKLLKKSDSRYQQVIEQFSKNNVFNVKVQGNRLLGI